MLVEFDEVYTKRTWILLCWSSRYNIIERFSCYIKMQYFRRLFCCPDCMTPKAEWSMFDIINTIFVEHNPICIRICFSNEPHLVGYKNQVMTLAFSARQRMYKDGKTDNLHHALSTSTCVTQCSLWWSSEKDFSVPTHIVHGQIVRCASVWPVWWERSI